MRAIVSVTNEGGRAGRLLWGLAETDRSRVGVYTLTQTSALAAGAASEFVNWSELAASAESATPVAKDIVIHPSDVWQEPVLFKLPGDAVAALVTTLVYVQWASEIRPYRFKVVAMMSDSKMDA